MKKALSFLVFMMGMAIFSGVVLLKIDNWEKISRAEIQKVIVDFQRQDLLMRQDGH